MKIGVIGCGLVGSTAAYALIMQGIGREIILVDLNKARAEAEADDLQHAVPFANPLHVTAGNYPDLEDARVLPDLEDALMAQVRNHLEGFDEWLVLERIKGKGGLNDKIQAPEEVVENGEGKIVRIHDDHTSSDVLATWCADHQKELQEELSKSGVGYFIPAASVGIGVTSSMRLGGGMGAIQSGNPIQAMQNLMLSRQQQQIKPTQPKGKPKDWLKSVLGPR